MKKLSKLVLSNRKMILMNKELKQLKGGYDGDVINTNEVNQCKCAYNNHRDIDNNNKKNGCGCYCI